MKLERTCTRRNLQRELSDMHEVRIEVASRRALLCRMKHSAHVSIGTFSMMLLLVDFFFVVFQFNLLFKLLTEIMFVCWRIMCMRLSEKLLIAALIKDLDSC